MAQKQVIFSAILNDKLTLTDSIYALDTLANAQQYEILVRAGEQLPATIIVEQRTPNNAIDVQINNVRLKIDRRGKVQKSYMLV